MAENTQIESLEYGNVNISSDVIEIITSISASEIEGISGLSSGFAEDIAGIFTKKTHQKGVKVEIIDELVVVDLNVIVDYGIKIPDVSWKVQENVKNAIESMTGLNVKEVNIHVSGININKTAEIDE